MVKLEDIEETTLEGYKYTCKEEDCDKEITATKLDRVKYLAKEHEKKHKKEER